MTAVHVNIVIVSQVWLCTKYICKISRELLLYILNINVKGTYSSLLVAPDIMLWLPGRCTTVGQ